MTRHLLKTTLVLATILTVMGAITWYLWQDLQRPLPIPDDGMIYEVSDGATIRSVARDMTSRGWLPSPWYLEAWSRWIEPGGAIRRGEYFIAPGTTISSLLTQFREGKPVQHKLIIVEGSRFSDVVSSLRKAIDEGLIKQVIPAGQYEAAFREISGQESPEGWVFPDTYYFPKGQTDKGFLRQAYSRMKQTLDEVWSQRDNGLPLKSPYEALILASIVEKETAAAEERPLIAGVFINRLKKGMKLQTDPTVIYGMGEAYKGNIRTRDLRKDTPYNTYTRKGLPPTPIAMPGKEALMAVVKPAKTDALFFVAKGRGRHYFSTTYKEHKKAVIKYLLGGNAARYRGDD